MDASRVKTKRGGGAIPGAYGSRLETSTISSPNGDPIHMDDLSVSFNSSEPTASALQAGLDRSSLALDLQRQDQLALRERRRQLHRVSNQGFYHLVNLQRIPAQRGAAFSGAFVGPGLETSTLQQPAGSATSVTPVAPPSAEPSSLSSAGAAAVSGYRQSIQRLSESIRAEPPPTDEAEWALNNPALMENVGGMRRGRRRGR